MHVEVPPTKQWMDKHHGNVMAARNAKGEEVGTVQIRHGCGFEILCDEFPDFLVYEWHMNRFRVAWFTYDAFWGKKANAPLIESGDGDTSMPDAPALIDLYIFLIKIIKPEHMYWLQTSVRDLPEAACMKNARRIFCAVRFDLESAMTSLAGALSEFKNKA